jgi:hypothetical protein
MRACNKLAGLIARRASTHGGTYTPIEWDRGWGAVRGKHVPGATPVRRERFETHPVGYVMSTRVPMSISPGAHAVTPTRVFSRTKLSRVFR